jgi:hypothetical protein
MEEICGNCRHFEAKGLMLDKDTWGLCTKSEKKNTGNLKESAIFRWGDDICADFKLREESKPAIGK